MYHYLVVRKRKDLIKSNWEIQQDDEEVKREKDLKQKNQLSLLAPVSTLCVKMNAMIIYSKTRETKRKKDKVKKT